MSRPKKNPHAIVKEPVQVYLDAPDRALLDRVVDRSGLSRAEILRRGLRAYGSEVLSGDSSIHALLREFDAGEWPQETPRDVGVNHDKYLADTYADTHDPKTVSYTHLTLP